MLTLDVSNLSCVKDVKETFGERLKRLRLARKMTQEQLAKLAGVSRPTVTMWETEASAFPEAGNLVRAAVALGVTPNYLESGEETGRGLMVSEPKYLYPRMYENIVAGQGRGRVNEDYHLEVDGTIAIPSWLVAARGWNMKRLAVVKTKGRSMYPTLGEDEAVVVNLDDVKVVHDKIYAIQDPDEGLQVKRLLKQLDGRILVRSDNQDKATYPDDFITPESRTRVVARVCYRAGEL